MSDENVTDSIATNTLDLMEIYRATVTPRNNVSRYINGSSVAMQGYRIVQNAIHTALLLLLLSHREIHALKWINTVPADHVKYLQLFSE